MRRSAAGRANDMRQHGEVAVESAIKKMHEISKASSRNRPRSSSPSESVPRR